MTVSLYPQVERHQDLADLEWRTRWYFRQRLEAGERVVIPVKQGLRRALHPPFYLEADERTPSPLLSSEDALDVARTAETVIVWDRSARLAAPAWLRRNAVIGDELCDVGAAENWSLAVSSVLTGDSERRFREACARLRAENRCALLIGSGPSMPLAVDPGYCGPSINIYGGSAVLHDDMIAAREPHFVAAPDIAAHLGPSKTAARYRERLFDVLDRSNALVLMPEPSWRSLTAWWPDRLKDRVIALPVAAQRKISDSFLDDFSYEPTSNVLTSFMLPAAAAVSTEFYFAGIDGRGDTLEESGVWRHAREGDYRADLLDAALAHGRLHVVDIDAYYADHWARAAAICAAMSETGIAIHAPAVIAGNAASLKQVALKRRKERYAQLLFSILDAADDRPNARNVAFGVVGAVLGGVAAMNIVFGALAGAFILLIFAMGYFSLRMRMSRLAAIADRAQASEQSRAMMALGARIDMLEQRLKASGAPSEDET